MPKKKVVYEKSRPRENYTFHPGRLFNLEYLQDPGPCSLYVLDHRQATVLRRMLAVFPKYHWVWGLPSPRQTWDATTQQLWQDISELAEETEACLVSGCDVNDLITAINNINVNANVGELTKAVKELTAVIASQQRDLTLSIPDNVDYSASGIDKRLADFLDQLGSHPQP